MGLAAPDKVEKPKPPAVISPDMSGLLLPVIIVMALGALCFGCGCLTAFIVTRNQWRHDMIKRGFANYNERTGKWEWGEQASRRH